MGAELAFVSISSIFPVPLSPSEFDHEIVAFAGAGVNVAVNLVPEQMVAGAEVKNVGGSTSINPVPAFPHTSVTL
jgi:hypothetical protein